VSCGDGVTNTSAGEECDGGPGCLEDCTLEPSACSGEIIIANGEECHTGVEDQDYGAVCLSDAIAGCYTDFPNHGKVASCSAKVLNNADLTLEEHTAIQACVGQSDKGKKVKP